MRTLIKSLSIVLLIVGTATMAEAKRGRGGFRQEIFKQLDLTPEQQAQLKELRSNRQGMKDLRQEKKAIREKFQAALARDASETELRDLHKKKMELKQEMSNARFEKMMEVRKVLTSDQRLKLHELMKEKRASWREKRKSRGQ